MGTSLSGLTPATTFDGLLKVGDNDPLTADLKAISDGSGNDSAIQLSTGELKVLGQFNLDSANSLTTMNLRGDSLVINQIYQANEVTYNSIAMVNSSGIRLNNGTTTTLVARGGDVGIGNSSNAPDARLHVKGGGADDTTTSLLVQNSDGVDMLKVDDAGKTTIVTDNIGLSNAFEINTSTAGLFKVSNANNTTTPVLSLGHGSQDTRLTMFSAIGFRAQGINIAEMTSSEVRVGGGSGARLAVKGSAPSGDPLNNPTALLVQNSAGTDLLKVTDDGKVNVRSQLFVNHASISSRSLALGWGAVSANSTSDELSIYGGGSINGSIMYLNASAKTTAPQAIGMKTTGVLISPSMVQSSFAPSAQLHIKGSGNDDTTTALLVQNSDGEDMLSVKDDLSVVFNSTITSASSTLRFDVGGTGTIRMNSDKVAIGGNTTPTARLHIKGEAPVEDPPGTFSNPTALLVENSAGADLLRVYDSGQVLAAGYFSVGTSVFGSGYARVRTTKLYPSQSGHGINVQADTTTTAPDASAILQADSTTQGFLPPRMTDAERDAITTPAKGLMIYDTSNNQMNYWNGTAWIAF